MIEPNQSARPKAADKPLTKLWIYPSNEKPDGELLEACGGSAVLAQVLVRRGFNTPAAVAEYLDEKLYKPAPYSALPNVDKAVARLVAAIEKKEKITVYGDYDVDGITGTSVLLTVLRKLEANVDFYIPNRASEGYGLNLKAVSVLASKQRTKLIVTCDCGVSNFSEINLAKSLGVDSLVLDHHTMPEMLPPAVAVVHPKLLDENHPLFHLPGVGVAYKVCEGLLDHFGRIAEAQELLDYVTLGMIADLVPLVRDNRYLVKIGLTALVQSKRPGIRALLEQVGGKEDTDLVGFGLAPRINAVGRLSDAATAVELMTTDDEAKAKELAEQLQRDNARRQELCERIYQEAEHRVLTTVDLDRDKGIAIYSEGWHHGVVGIVASRLVERFGRPVFIGELEPEDGMVKGSARGVEQIDLYEVLKANEHLLSRFGGHKMAAGFTIEADKAEAAAKGIVAACNRLLAQKSLRGRLELDGLVEEGEVSIDLVRSLNLMAPFGMSNRKPILCLAGGTVSAVKPLGRDGKHSRIMVQGPSREFECVMWNSRGRVPDSGEQIDLAFNADINNFGGRERLQLVLVDWRKHGVSQVETEQEETVSFEAPSGRTLTRMTGAVSGQDGSQEKSGESVTDTAPADALNMSPLLRLNFKDLRGFSGNPEVVKKATAKLDKGVFVYGEGGEKLTGIELCDRTQVRASEHLLIWQFPPALKNFQELLFATGARNIYVVGNGTVESEPSAFLKQVLGLVRFACNQRDGQVEGEKLAAVLAATKMSVALALSALKRVHWIDWFSENGMIYLDMLGQPVTSVEETPEYKQLVTSLAQTDKFRLWCRESSMKELQLALVPNQIGLSESEETPVARVSGPIQSVTLSGD